MTSDQPVPGKSEPATDPLRAVTEAGGDGGDPACWACLVCAECGAVVSEGHRADCSRSARAAGAPRAGA